LASFHVRLNLGVGLARLQAGGEIVGIQLERVGVSLEQRSGILLAAPLTYFLKENVVHGPEVLGSLLASAKCGLGRWPRLGMDGI
jgi:hypothetical protein